MRKRTGFAACILAVCMTLGACSDASFSAGDPAEPGKTVDDATITDSTAVYDQDDDTSVVTMYLTVSQGNSLDNTDHTWTEVNTHSVYYYEELGVDRYAVEGILQVGDENGPTSGSFGYGEFAPNCTVQIRGKTSTRSPQKSYKISIRKNEGYWRDQRTIALNKHVYDSVRFRNKLSYDLLKTIPGAFAARTQFVHLYVKDLTEGASDASFEDYGLYTQVEQFNKAYLRNHGLDENGQLYKAGMFEFLRYEDSLRLTSDPEYDQTAFEQVLEIKGSDDHEKLLQMLDDLNNYSIPIETTFAKYFDEENYFTWLAFQLLTGNTDTTSQNFYLYSPQNGTKWYFLSWDNDGAWQYEEEVAFKGVGSGYNYTRGVSNYWGSVLHQRVLKSETYRQKLDEKMEELQKLITKERIAKLVEQYSAITRSYLSVLPDQMYAPCKMTDYERILEMIPREMEEQYEMYRESLTRPMPFYLAVPEHAKDGLMFGWDTSYDFDGEKVSYTFELAKDYQFKTVLDTQKDLMVPQAFTKSLEPGQYFYRVISSNESGRTQTAMETYQDADGKKYYGVFCFYVQQDGTIIYGN